MYFLKKNALNIIIFTLIFGVVGTLINLVIPVQSVDYEEYYTLEDETSPDTADVLNMAVNEQMNTDYPVKAVEIDHTPDSNMIQLNIHSNDSEDITGLKSQFDDILNEEGYTVEAAGGMNIYETENTFLKAFILAASLFIGLIIGIVSALVTRNISTEEDFEYYLGEKTLGRF